MKRVSLQCAGRWVAFGGADVGDLLGPLAATVAAPAAATRGVRLGFGAAGVDVEVSRLVALVVVGTVVLATCAD